MKARALLSALALALGALLPPACADDPATSIVVAISSEAAIPKEIDSLSIQITRGDRTRFARSYEVDPTTGTAKLPGTLTVQPGEDEDPDAPVKIQIIGNVRDLQVVLRSATAAFVEGKQKLLRIALRYSCLDAPLTCETGQTCIGGRCASDFVNTARLPDLGGGEVFPTEGSDGCFDASEGATGCAREPRIEVPDMATFTAAGCVLDTKGTAAQLANLNVFVFWRSKLDQAHPLPLEAHSPEGWDTPASNPAAFQLAPGLCDAVKEQRIRKVVYSFNCASKSESTPVCLPASGRATDATFFESACHRCVYYRQGPGETKDCQGLFKAATSSQGASGTIARCADQCTFDGRYDTGDECVAVRSCFFTCLAPYVDCASAGTCGKTYPELDAWNECLAGYDYEQVCATTCSAEGADRCQ